MRLRRSSLSTLLAVVGAVAVAAILIWALQLGAPATLASGRLSTPSMDTSYTRMRAAAAISTEGRIRASESWTFGRVLPQGWSLSAGASVLSHDHRIRLVTGPTTEIQARSPILRLPPGVYRALLQGSVESGGLYIGVESPEVGTCAAAAYFDQKSTGKRRAWLPLDFRSDGRPLRLVLGNWTETPRNSVWLLSNLQIVDRTSAVRASAEAKTYAATASPLVPASKLVNFAPVVTWSFAYKVPSDWDATPGVRTQRSLSSSGRLVTTNHDQYGYVFSRLIQLSSGSYFLRFRGKILSGGLALGVESKRTKKWIAQTSYWYGQADSNGIMGVGFDVPRDEAVKLVVANWSIAPANSRWLVQRIELDNLR